MEYYFQSCRASLSWAVDLFTCWKRQLGSIQNATVLEDDFVLPNMVSLEEKKWPEF